MKQPIRLVYLLCVHVIITGALFPAAVFIHEATHYVMYSLEGIEVTSFHVLDYESLTQGRVGYITVPKESRYGSLFQEIVAHIITCLFLASTLLFCLVKPLKRFVVQHLKKTGLKRRSRYNIETY